MIWLHQLETEAFWQILVRAMLHTLWQGAAIAILLWAALRFMAGAGPPHATRHRVRRWQPYFSAPC